MSGLRAAAEPKLTFALATAPLSAAQLKAIGLSSRRPFYTVDFPYLWGRLLESNGVIFGSGLVPAPIGMPFRIPTGARSIENGVHDLLRFTPQGSTTKGFTPKGFAPKGYDVRRGEAAERLRWLENRVCHLHPALASVRVTHRWGGPILFTEKMLPIFRWLTPQGFATKGFIRKGLPRSKQVLVLAGYNGHGVALSVYLGKWAAEALLAHRPLPRWS
jgi:glycine/D-amino acid oxidase-like deaminating enzyme